MITVHLLCAPGSNQQKKDRLCGKETSAPEEEAGPLLSASRGEVGRWGRRALILPKDGPGGHGLVLDPA